MPAGVARVGDRSRLDKSVDLQYALPHLDMEELGLNRSFIARIVVSLLLIGLALFSALFSTGCSAKPSPTPTLVNTSVCLLEHMCSPLLTLWVHASVSIFGLGFVPLNTRVHQFRGGRKENTD